MFTLVLVLLLIASVVLGIWWFIASWQVVGPTEMAVPIIFGEPREPIDSGTYFYPWADLSFVGIGNLCYLEIYPKKKFQLPYEKVEVLTKAGLYDGEYYGVLNVKVDSALYLSFPRAGERDPTLDFEREGEDGPFRMDAKGNKIPRTHPLVKILRSNVPKKEEDLKDFSEEAVLSALRHAASQVTWKKFTEDRQFVSNEVTNSFKQAKGPLVEAGFRPVGISAVILDIKLPPEIEDALPDVDRARLEAKAAEDVAKKVSTEINSPILGALAGSRGKNVEEIKKLLKDDVTDPNNIKKADEGLQKEFLELAKDMLIRRQAIEGNALFDIRAPGAGGLDKLAFALLAMLRRGNGNDGVGPVSGVAVLPAEPEAKKGKAEKKDKDKNKNKDKDKDEEEYPQESEDEE